MAVSSPPVIMPADGDDDGGVSAKQSFNGDDEYGIVPATQGVGDTGSSSDHAPGADEFYKYLKNCAANNYLMGCSISKKKNPDGTPAPAGEIKRPDGLYEGHAYSLLGMHEVKNMNGEIIKLFHLRNPWGADYEWKGRFSDDDT